MRSIPVRSITVCALLVAVLTFQVFILRGDGAEPKERKLGPEWKKTVDGYEKTIEVKVYRHAHASANANFYTLPLEHGRSVTVTELDSGHLCEVAMGEAQGQVRSTECSIRAVYAKAGEPKSYDVNLRGTIYFDLNADGRLDRLYNRSKGKPEGSYLLLDTDWVRVEDSKVPGETAWGEDRKVQYTLKDGKWVAEPQK
jgi:hypothetical protein